MKPKDFFGCLITLLGVFGLLIIVFIGSYYLTYSVADISFKIIKWLNNL